MPSYWLGEIHSLIDPKQHNPTPFLLTKFVEFGEFYVSSTDYWKTIIGELEIVSLISKLKICKQKSVLLFNVEASLLNRLALVSAFSYSTLSSYPIFSSPYRMFLPHFIWLARHLYFIVIEQQQWIDSKNLSLQIRNVYIYVCIYNRNEYIYIVYILI